VNSPTEYIHKLAECLAPVGTEELRWQNCVARVLAKSITAERDSPAQDVSSMDGFALRSSDLSADSIPVFCTIAAGYPPSDLPAGACAKIFTGAVVPKQADFVVRREDVIEASGSIVLKPGVSAVAGENIRRRGENAKQGSTILPAGIALNQATVGAVLSGASEVVQVHRRVRVAIINTGDELVDKHQPMEPWQIRDSNGPTLEFFFHQLPWIDLIQRQRVLDSPEVIRQHLAILLPAVDAICLTGGVSMGDADHVPQAIQDVGANIVFHRIPIRPGKPILGAATADGKLILGLPGNPVSVAVTALVIGLPLLRRLAGFTAIDSNPCQVRISNWDSITIPLTWYRLAKAHRDGTVSLIDTHGSGDIISLANSDGVVEVPPGSYGPGPFAWYPWK
jgi:molybdopterin molybdotransferase